MASALILITTEIGMVDKVYDKIRKMEDIQKATMITGPYDIMAIARGDDVREIGKITVHKIRNIEGVKSTVTNVVIE